MLEINAQPARDLRQLIEAIGQKRVERELNVHRTTILRWLAGTVRIPGKAHHVIKLLLGDMPGTAGKWTGWRFHDGQLLSPGGDAYNPGDVPPLVLLRQQLTAQRREIDQLKTRCAVFEAGLRIQPPTRSVPRVKASLSHRRSLWAGCRCRARWSRLSPRRLWRRRS